MAIKVRCNDCFWQGTENDIPLDAATDEEYCPSCEVKGCLMDLDDDETQEAAG